jgi:small subunit ribosomal protein S16
LVVLRLTRTGKKKQAHYRVVVADSRRFVNSKFISIVGWYNPHTKEVELKKDEITQWLEKGAQPSNTVAKILKDNGVKLPDWVKITKKVNKPKKEPVAKAVKEAVPEETKNPEEEAPESEATEEVAPNEEKPEETQVAETEASEPEANEEETEKNPE